MIDIKVKINNEEIERVYSTKFLGVTIDAKLTWKEHITNIKAKLSKCLAILFKCSKILNLDSLRTLYCSLFLPYISYCSEVWGTTYKSTVKCVSILQKKALRIICKQDMKAHTSGLFHELKLLKFEDLVDLKCCIIMYKIHSKELPPNLLDKFNLVGDTGRYVLRNHDKFKVKHKRTTKMAHCLSSYGVKLYNSLPTSLTSLKNVLLFKRKYTSYLINQYT